MSLTIYFLGALFACSYAHQLCGLDSSILTSPQNNDLSFCTEYTGNTCCDLSDDDSIAQYFLNNPVSVQCEPYYKQYLCTKCDPYQAHLFNLEPRAGELPRDEPYLCDSFISDLVANCPELSIDPSSLIGEEPWCYPVQTTPSGEAGLDAFYGPVPGLIDYRDLGNGKFLIATKDGIIYEVDENNQGQPSVFLDISDKVYTQQELGLLTFELDPDYETNGYYYVYYSVRDNPDDIPNAGNDRINYLSKFKNLQGNANPYEECLLVYFVKGGWNHNGGDIAFVDINTLLLSVGDGAPQRGNGNGQDTTNLFGSVIAIQPKKIDTCDPLVFDYTLPENIHQTITNNYEIPASNPWVGVVGYRPELYAIGFRNPWRMTYDEETGVIFTGDVGQTDWEELDIVVSGGNYGWEVTEGNNCFVQDQQACDEVTSKPEYEAAVYDYPHDTRTLRPGETCYGFTIVAGHRYTGSIRPDLEGKIIFSEWWLGEIWSLVSQTDDIWSGAERVAGNSAQIVGIRKDKQGESVFVSFPYGDGFLYRFKPLSDDPDVMSTYGNYICELGESCDTHPVDCQGVLTGPQSDKWCCANGECDFGDCPVQCNSTIYTISCGNGYCEFGEDCNSCPYDCPSRPAHGNDDQNGYCCIGPDEEGGSTVCVPTVEGSDVCSAQNDPCYKGNKQGPGNGIFD